MRKFLVIGSAGQIGSELVLELRRRFGVDAVVASDVRETDFNSGVNVVLDVLNKEALTTLIDEQKITDVYLLAALLSATAEKNPDFAWELNMDGLFNVLNLAKEGKINKVFWPSSIAVFGPSTPKQNTPQETITEPTTVYGISKLAGERWCQYYHDQYGVDVRSLRYPGLISWKSRPGGGTTDYAIDIFYKAIQDTKYSCFLSEDTALPMMYMDDAIAATIELMEADPERLTIRSSYNVGGVSFTPKEIYEEILAQKPGFEIEYNPDFRQKIADSWPSSIDDTIAKRDWNLANKNQLVDIVKDMIFNLSKTLSPIE